ncbi:MAG: DUF3301 domain-containing protein [Pseudomonadota bacterium]
MDVAIPSILVLATLALWWSSATRAREFAREYARQFCLRQQWQLLDQTVALQFMRPSRRTGRWQLRRSYRFEFSPDGGHRRRGELVMIGHRLVTLRGELEDGGHLIE